MSYSRLRGAIFVTVLDAVVLLILASLFGGVHLRGFGTALAAAALVGLSNALLWPAISRVALPLNVLTLGLAGLLLNGLLFGAVIDLLPGAGVDGFGEAVLLTVILTASTATVESLLSLDGDEWWYRQVVGRQARRRGLATASEVPGLLMLEIDGLAHEVLLRALRDGSAPNLAAWIRSGSHRLRSWETDWSSQTGACQAGILHGSNDDMPAFRWWVEEGECRAAGHHPPARRRRDRAPPPRGARAALRRRPQPRQHPLRRRAPL